MAMAMATAMVIVKLMGMGIMRTMNQKPPYLKK